MAEEDDKKKNPYEGWKPAEVAEYERLIAKREASGNQVQLSPQGGPMPAGAKARWEFEQRRRDSTYTRADAARLHEIEGNHGLKLSTAGEDPVHEAVVKYDRAQRAWGGVAAEARHRAAYRRQQAVGGPDNVAKLDTLQAWYKENSGSWGDVLSAYGLSTDDWAKLDPVQRIQMGSAMLDLQKQSDGTYKVGGVDEASRTYNQAKRDLWDRYNGLGFKTGTGASDTDQLIAKTFTERFGSANPADKSQIGTFKIDGVADEDVASWLAKYNEAMQARDTMNDAKAKARWLPYQRNKKTGQWEPTR